LINDGGVMRRSVLREHVLWLKQCPKCGGDLIDDTLSDWWKEISCVQCGFRSYDGSPRDSGWLGEHKIAISRNIKLKENSMHDKGKTQWGVWNWDKKSA
jgi:hypothetical protein